MLCANRTPAIAFALVLTGTLGGCGLFTPEKDFLHSDNHEPGMPSPRGEFENIMVRHIRCEISHALLDVLAMNGGPRWITDWGAQVTLKLTVEEQSGLNPGVSVFTPLQNVIKPFPFGGNILLGRSRTVSAGASVTAKATRLETIAFTYAFADLIDEARKEVAAGQYCDYYQNGVMVQSDLKIRQFIYDKAFIATTGEATTKDIRAAPYTTFSEDLTFVASYGGSVTPTWKFARITVDPNSPTASATRSHTDEVIITLAKATPATKRSPAQLSPQGQLVHNAQVTGSFTASSIQSTTH